ncbi:hypothetical protein GCM10012320_17700 [Sinomonas cellulolyticus]|uniref:Metallophosphoesterase n=1 Tax=Sinomonas cellulolyticus TaxID=2801916 RepID=A0ABS1K762_9MICC|nr:MULTISPECIES: metallophosphoesterase [Sinomonas]MBL0707152.1 metallophosphoesterase [Sinomonas cellulolyticus]GHG49761.1 hypothetical protein GCM10012320_17700 [Sinomonas sp. KCTC 49339]
MIVLRFSNYDFDTIGEHQQVISDKGYAYWGWWKKQHEPWPGSQINRLATSCSQDSPARIGLVERQAERFYVAECEEVTCEAADPIPTPIPTPDPERTPQYYRDRPWPMWLKFRSINEVEPAKWSREFGPVPQGDETFFYNDHTHGVDVMEVDVPGNRSGILHISDLHFGDDFAFTNDPGIRKRNDLLECIVESLEEPPLAVVVSGDLTTRGDDGGMRSARLFIERLAERLKVPRACVIIAPGNHDILIDDPDRHLDFSNEQCYRDMVRLFYDRHTGLERVHVIRGDSQRLVFGVLNSSRPRTRANMDYGYVGRDRSEPVMREMSEKTRANDCPGFLVLHHHVQPAPVLEFLEDDRPVSLTLDSGEIISFAQKYGVRAILHGHQHLPFVGTTSRLAEISEDGPTPSPGNRTDVLILGAGSAGARADRLGGEMPENSFAHYLPQDDGRLRVRVFRYTPVIKPKLLWDFCA